MSTDPKSPGERSVYVGGNAFSVITGDDNLALLSQENSPKGSAEGVDIAGALSALQAIIGELETPDRTKIQNAFAEAVEELTRGTVNKEEVGKAVDRAMGYAAKTAGFSAVIPRARPLLVNAARWLGSQWLGLLNYVGGGG